MGTRLELHGELLDLAPYAYYQPVSSVKLNYPCFIYKLADIRPTYADNRRYQSLPYYTLTYISLRPADDKVKEILEHFSYCKMERPYMADNLYHYVFNLFY